MDFSKELQAEIDRGFTKSQLERIIGLPQNSLSGILKGVKKLSKKSTLKVQKYLAGEKPDPLDPTSLINRKIQVADFKNIVIHELPAKETGDYVEGVDPHSGPVEYDFTGMKFLDLDKFTQFRLQDRPANRFERAVWEQAKKDADQKIKDAWANRNNK